MKYTPIQHYHRNLVLMFVAGVIVGALAVFAWINSII